MVALVLFTQSALFSRALPSASTFSFSPPPFSHSLCTFCPPLKLGFFYVAKDKHKKQLRFISWSNISSVLIFPHCYCCNMKQFCTLSIPLSLSSSFFLLLSLSACLSVPFSVTLLVVLLLHLTCNRNNFIVCAGKLKTSRVHRD